MRIPIFELMNTYFLRFLKYYFSKLKHFTNTTSRLTDTCNETLREIVSRFVNAGQEGREDYINLCISCYGKSIVSISDENGDTALSMASSNGNKRIVRLLLSKGSNPNSFNMRSCTALMNACDIGHKKIVRMLLAAEANVNAQDMFGQTPLMKAAAAGHEHILKLLLEAGADVNIISSLAHYVSQTKIFEYENTKVERRLVEVNPQDQKGQTALIKACDSGHMGIVVLLLNARADLNVADANGYTALVKACENGSKDIVQILLDAGSDVNASTSGGGGFTALIKACETGHKRVVRMLLEAGALVDAKDKDGRTALIRASQKGHRGIVQQLLAGGASVNAEDQNGYTSLIMASKNGHKNIVQMLLRAGASVNAKDTTIFESTAFLRAFGKGFKKIMKILLEAGADVNAKSSYDGCSALMTACNEGQRDMVKMLLDAGADVNIRDCEGGYTPLILACTKGHKRIVKMLLAAGADVYLECSVCTRHSGSGLVLQICLLELMIALEVAGITLGDYKRGRYTRSTPSNLYNLRNLKLGGFDNVPENVALCYQGFDVLRMLVHHIFDSIQNPQVRQQYRRTLVHETCEVAKACSNHEDISDLCFIILRDLISNDSESASRLLSLSQYSESQWFVLKAAMIVLQSSINTRRSIQLLSEGFTIWSCGGMQNQRSMSFANEFILEALGEHDIPRALSLCLRVILTGESNHTNGVCDILTGAGGVEIFIQSLVVFERMPGVRLRLLKILKALLTSSWAEGVRTKLFEYQVKEVLRASRKGVKSSHTKVNHLLQDVLSLLD